MKIQIVSYDTIKENNKNKDIKLNDFSSVENFDNFDFNIIDLNHKNLWEYNENKKTGITSMPIENEMYHIKNRISYTQKVVLLVLPENIKFKDWLNEDTSIEDLKERFAQIINRAFIDIFKLFDDRIINFVYEPNKLKLNGNKYKSDFFITESELVDIVKAANNNSEKGLLVKINEINNLYITSLYNILELGNISDLISELLSIETEPRWISNYNFYTDIEMKKNNEELLKKIEQINGLIDKNNVKLEKNNKYKKVLYASGDFLVSIVTEIFEIMLNYNCSDFIDKKKEDLRIKYDNQTFIIEIKGENDGVNKSNISQLVTHIEEYEEKLTKTNQPSENIKGILIKNEFKNKPINEREKIHHEVIEKSERNDCLIITSKLLLDLFEMFLRDEITSEEIKTILIKQTGLINIK